MSERHARAFPDLAPPGGGLARLRARIDGRERRRARLLTLAFVPSLALAAAVALVVVRTPAEPLPDHPSLAHTGGAAVVVRGAAGVAVPLGGGVTMYWVP